MGKYFDWETILFRVEIIILNYQLITDQKVDVQYLVQLMKKEDLEGFTNSLKGANSNLMDKDGFTIMQHAVMEDGPEFVKALLDANVDANVGEGDKKPVLLAAKLGRCRILKLFKDFEGQEESKFKIDFDVCTTCNKPEQNLCGGENVLHVGKF